MSSTPTAPPSWPEQCSKEAQLPWTVVFRSLRELAMDRGWTSAALARDVLDCEPKDVTTWADPNGRLAEKGEKRPAPLWACRRLASLVGMAIVIWPDAVQLVPTSQLPARS